MRLAALFFLVIFSGLFACKTKEKPEADKPNSNVNTQAPYYSNKVPENSPRITKVYDSSKMETNFPLVMYNDDTYLVALEPADTAVFAKFNPLFEKYGYSGSGYSYDGIIREILKREDNSLMQHLDFDADAGGFYVFADGPENQRKFASLVSQTLNNLALLEDIFRQTDRSKIND